MVEKLKNFDVERLDLNELVELSAVGRFLSDEYEKVGVDAPEWLPQNLKQLRREIRTRTADALEKDLAAKKAKLEGLVPAEERRKKLADEIAALEAKLAGVGA